MTNLVRPVLAVTLLVAMWGTPATYLAAQTTGTVRGTVTEASTRRPLPGKRSAWRVPTAAWLPGVRVSTRLGVPAGSTRVRVELVDYRLRAVEVTVPAGQAAAADFTLGASAVALDELVAPVQPGMHGGELLETRFR